MHHKPLYLVAIPEGAVMAKLHRLQKHLSQRFNMYTEPYPDLHLTVGVIEPPEDNTSVYPVLDKIIKSYRPFTVNVSGERCFGKPFSSVGVAVTSPQLAYLAGELEGALVNAAFVPRTFSEWDFHISLITPLFARRHWSQQEFNEACRIIAEEDPRGECCLNHLQLWDPDFPPLNVLKKFHFSS